MSGRPAWVKKRNHQREVMLKRTSELKKAASKNPFVVENAGVVDAQATLDRAGEFMLLRAEKHREEMQSKAEAIIKAAERNRAKLIENEEKSRRRAYFQEKNAEYLERWYAGDDDAILEYCHANRLGFERWRKYAYLLSVIEKEHITADDVFCNFIVHVKKSFDRKWAFEHFGMNNNYVFNALMDWYEKDLYHQVKILRLKTRIQRRFCVDLDGPISSDDKDGDTMLHYLSDPRNWYDEFMRNTEHDELGQYVRKQVQSLEPYDRKMCLLLMRGCSINQAADVFGCSRQAIDARLKKLAPVFNREKLCRFGFHVGKRKYKECTIVAEMLGCRVKDPDRWQVLHDRLQRMLQEDAVEIKRKSRYLRQEMIGGARKDKWRSTAYVRSMIDQNAAKEVEQYRKDVRNIKEVTEMTSDRELQEFDDAEERQRKYAEGKTSLFEALKNESDEMVQDEIEEQQEREENEEQEDTDYETQDMERMSDEAAEEQYEYFHGDGDDRSLVNYLAVIGC